LLRSEAMARSHVQQTTTGGLITKAQKPYTGQFNMISTLVLNA